MNKVKIQRSTDAPMFAPGELLELNVELDHMDYYIVMVQGVGFDNAHFSGMILAVNNPDDTDHFPGYQTDRFLNDSFKRFCGSIEITQK